MIDEKKLRFWCQKVLPVVYEDSLSYYELLNKVAKYLNSTIEDVETLANSFDSLSENVTTVENTVNQFDDRITHNSTQIDVLSGNIDAVESDLRKTMKYRGLTLTAASLAEIDSGAVQARYFTGYYTPQIGQVGLPSSESITANNQYKYLLAIINNFETDPFDTDDRSNRTWLLYGPNAKMWWTFGQTPDANSWFVFDPSAIDVSNLEQIVQNLSDQYEDVDARVNANTADISTLRTRTTQNTIKITNVENNVHNLETRINANEYYLIGETIGHFYGWLAGCSETTSRITFTIPLLKKALSSNQVKFTPTACKLGIIGQNGHIDFSNYTHDFLNDSNYTVRVQAEENGNLLYVQLAKVNGDFVNSGTSQAITPVVPVVVWTEDFQVRCDNP